MRFGNLRQKLPGIGSALSPCHWRHWGMGAAALCPATGRPHPLHLQEPGEGPRLPGSRLPPIVLGPLWETRVDSKKWVQAWVITLPRTTGRLSSEPYSKAGYGPHCVDGEIESRAERDDSMSGKAREVTAFTYLMCKPPPAPLHLSRTPPPHAVRHNLLLDLGAR